MKSSNILPTLISLVYDRLWLHTTHNITEVRIQELPDCHNAAPTYLFQFNSTQEIPIEHLPCIRLFHIFSVP